MTPATEPRIDDVDQYGKPKYKDLNHFQSARDAWIREDAVRKANSFWGKLADGLRALGWLMALLLIAGAFGYAMWQGYSDNKPPQLITADDTTYLACHGSSVSTDGTSGGEQVYSVTFDQYKVGRTVLRGVRKLTIIEQDKQACEQK